jgi:hypothetical protein
MLFAFAAATSLLSSSEDAKGIIAAFDALLAFFRLEKRSRLAKKSA